jgi:hypothetical protein
MLASSVTTAASLGAGISGGVFGAGAKRLVALAVETIAKDTKHNPDLPIDLIGFGWIRDARVIAGHLYAVGMSRQAYARTPDDKWLHIEGDMLAPLGALAGLNGVDGFSSTEIYAAGLNGEIWRHDGSAWKQLVSPTNVQLNAVRRCGDFIHVAGSSGVLLRGRHDTFNVVATEDNQENLYGLAPLGSDVFVTSMKKIFVLRDGQLEEVDTGLGEITAGALDANDGVLWSVGAKHIVHTADGKAWTGVPLRPAGHAAEPGKGSLR